MFPCTQGFTEAGPLKPPLPAGSLEGESWFSHQHLHYINGHIGYLPGGLVLYHTRAYLDIFGGNSPLHSSSVGLIGKQLVAWGANFEASQVWKTPWIERVWSIVVGTRYTLANQHMEIHGFPPRKWSSSSSFDCDKTEGSNIFKPQAPIPRLKLLEWLRWHDNLIGEHKGTVLEMDAWTDSTSWPHWACCLLCQEHPLDPSKDNKTHQNWIPRLRWRDPHNTRTTIYCLFACVRTGWNQPMFQRSLGWCKVATLMTNSSCGELPQVWCLNLLRLTSFFFQVCSHSSHYPSWRKASNFLWASQISSPSIEHSSRSAFKKEQQTCIVFFCKLCMLASSIWNISHVEDYRSAPADVRV